MFVFNRRFDYSEYGTMVEKRALPDHWQGHWRYNVIDAYACLVPPQREEFSLQSLVAEQLAGVYLDTLGRMPAWFTQGSAWAVGAAADPKDVRSKGWEESAPRILAGSSKADAFLTGGLPPGDTAVLNYSFCKFLMSNTKSYSGLLSAVKSGKSFDQAFAQSYGGDPKQLAGAWAAKALTARRR
jgi:hypothetical protein